MVKKWKSTKVNSVCVYEYPTRNMAKHECLFRAIHRPREGRNGCEL